MAGSEVPPSFVNESTGTSFSSADNIGPGVLSGQRRNNHKRRWHGVAVAGIICCVVFTVLMATAMLILIYRKNKQDRGNSKNTDQSLHALRITTPKGIQLLWMHANVLNIPYPLK